MAYNGIPPGTVYNDCIGWFIPGSSGDPFGRSVYTIYNVECLAKKAAHRLPEHTTEELTAWSLRDLLKILEDHSDQ